MNPKDLRLRNGMTCIDVDEADKTISVIVPEGWKVFAWPSDSGQRVRVEEHRLQHAATGDPSAVTVRPHRVDPKPTVDDSQYRMARRNGK